MSTKDVREIRFISPEPVLAKILSARKPLFMSETGYRWLLTWAADVGATIRSRDFMLNLIVSGLTALALDTLASVFEAFGLRGPITKYLLRRGK